MKFLEDRHRHSSHRKRLYFIVLLIVVASLISGVYGMQHLLLLEDVNWNLQKATFFTLFQAWDAEHYLAQMREITEGHYLLSNTYLAEYKNTHRSPWPVFPFYLCAFTAKILRLEVWQLAVLMDFFLPPLIFLLAYIFLHTLTRGRWLSCLGAFTLTVLPHLGRIEIIPLVFFRLLERGMTPPLLTEAHRSYDGCFSRTINPQLTYIFLLASLLCLAKFLHTSQKQYGVLSALFGIVLSYSYVYFSTYLYTCLGIIIICSLLFREKPLLSKTALILAGILIGSFPFWYQTFQFSHTNLSQMAWMVKDRTPRFFSVAGYYHVAYQIIFTAIVCTIIVIAILKKWMNKLPGFFAIALLASGIICLNQHVLTGIRVQENHYMKYVIPQATVLVVFLIFTEIRKTSPWRNFPLTAGLLYGGICLSIISTLMTPAFVATYFSPDGLLTPEIQKGITVFHKAGMIAGLLCFLGGVALKKFPGLLHPLYKSPGKASLMAFTGKLLSAVIMLLVLGDVSVGRYTGYHEQLKPELGYIQMLKPAFQWLNEHTPPESVVLGSLDLLSTSSMIPIYTHNNVYAAYHAQFYAVPPLSEFRHRVYTTMALMGIRSQTQVEQFREQTIWMITYPIDYRDYQESLTNERYSALKQYRVDYLFYGPRERQHFKIDPEQHYSFLHKMYDDEIVKIYRIL